ncbi:GH3 auxin-responsive promoter family protein [Flavobacteriales bacterium]|nr:GH3 auxin-responsive promoter family protein [Flavobacteriales bacterium]
MPVNTVFSWFIRKRLHQIALFKKYPKEVQEEVFRDHIEALSQTRFGLEHGVTAQMDLKAYRKSVPLRDYNGLKMWLEAARNGEPNVMWPGAVRWNAKSSGTTTDRSKFIPVTEAALEKCHYKGGKDLLAMYVDAVPKARLYGGRHLIVGGTGRAEEADNGVLTGDLSAIIINNLPWWCEFRRTPARAIALMASWEDKIERMAETTIDQDVRIIAGVPSWTQVLLERILERTGKSHLGEVWPHLQLYMHGGVSFAPYRNAFDRMMPAGIHYIETYNASEGFFGIQDRLGADDMLLMLDYGIHYEFIPFTPGDDILAHPHADTLGLQDVELDRDYALVVSTNGGLHRYVLGDLVRFTSLTPFRIRVSGRTQSYLNLAGEELMVGDANVALAHASRQFAMEIRDWTACARPAMAGTKGRHHWVIEPGKGASTPIEAALFSAALDRQLRALNSDYDAKRTGDLVLDAPLVEWASTGTFENLLKQKGKLGGQHKVPRLSMTPRWVEEVSAMNFGQTEAHP